jgi:hypothetical protein
MILNQDVTAFFIIIVLLVFYFLQTFQKVKLVYLFRSLNYHFRNILVPYGKDDLGISGSGTSVINYFHYFYIFFFLLINGVIMTYYVAASQQGYIKTYGMSTDYFLRLLNFNILILGTLFIRFIIIRYVLGMFINSSLKLIFYKNYIVNIIIALLMFLNFVIFNLNPFYDFNYLKIISFLLIGLHFIFQIKNYLSYFLKFDPKEVMYLILYLCAFKLAPWIWLFSNS